MLILGQVEESVASVIDRLPTDEIMALMIAVTALTAVFGIVVTVCVTRTIRSIRVASIKAALADKLSKQGFDAEQIEKIVRATSRNGLDIKLPEIPNLQLPARWQKAEAKPPQVTQKYY